MTDLLFEPGWIGTAALRNRVIRAGTSESMAEPESGEMTPALLGLYERLAVGGVGGIITGHLYVAGRGKYARGQTGIHDDGLLPGLTNLTERVHSHGAIIFAQLAHAGSQSRVPDNVPVAPSPVPNPLTGNPVEAATPRRNRRHGRSFWRRSPPSGGLRFRRCPHPRSERLSHQRVCLPLDQPPRRRMGWR